MANTGETRAGRVRAKAGKINVDDLRSARPIDRVEEGRVDEEWMSGVIRAGSGALRKDGEWEVEGGVARRAGRPGVKHCDALAGLIWLVKSVNECGYPFGGAAGCRGGRSPAEV